MQILKGHTNRVHALAFSADGRHLLTGSGDETARLWDLSTGSEVARCHTESYSVYYAQFVPNRTPWQILVGIGNKFWLWAPDTGRKTLVENLCCLSQGFTPDGTALVTLRGPGEGDVYFWDPTTWKVTDTWSAKPSIRNGLAFSPDGKLLATGCEDGTASIWDTSSGKVVASVGQPAPPHGASPAAADYYISYLAFVSHSQTLVTGTSQTLTVWDLTTKQALARHRQKGKHYQGISVSPDGRLLATANNDATARFRRLPGLEEQAAYNWKLGPILTIAFAPDGLRCAAAGRSGKVLVWDVDD